LIFDTQRSILISEIMLSEMNEGVPP